MTAREISLIMSKRFGGTVMFTLLTPWALVRVPALNEYRNVSRTTAGCPALSMRPRLERYVMGEVVLTASSTPPNRSD